MGSPETFEDPGFVSYPAPPWGFVTQTYASLAAEHGIELPDGLLIVGSFDEITPELLNLRDELNQRRSILQRIGDRTMRLIGMN